MIATGVAPGVARLTFTVDAASDSARVGVLGPSSILSTAFVGGQARAEAAPGATITVPVTFDMTRVSATGDLGSVGFELSYDPALLTFVSGEAGVSGTVVVNGDSPGTVAFGAISTAAQGSGSLTLVTLTFTVSPSAVPGTGTALGLVYADAPTNVDVSQLVEYEIPVALGGWLRIR